MINPKDIDLSNPETINNLSSEFIKEFGIGTSDKPKEVISDTKGENK